MPVIEKNLASGYFLKQKALLPEERSALRQQHHQRTGATVCRAGLGKGQHFFFLDQPAVHPAFEHRRFAR